jgi:hypothetical protein
VYEEAVNPESAKDSGRYRKSNRSVDEQVGNLQQHFGAPPS